jgi:hypothetical protein
VNFRDPTSWPEIVKDGNHHPRQENRTSGFVVRAVGILVEFLYRRYHEAGEHSKTMEYPNCKLISPPETVFCDCGYDFERRVQTSECRVETIPSRGRGRVRWYSFLPAGFALVPDLLFGGFFLVFTIDGPGQYPMSFLPFQIVMLAMALLIAVPVLWVWVAAVLVIIGAMVIGLTSFAWGWIVWCYLPTLIAGLWVTAKEGWCF